MLKKFAVLSIFSISLLLCAAAPEKDQFRAPALQDQKSWTMVVVPDIQSYIRRQEKFIFSMCQHWLKYWRKENSYPLLQ